MLKTALIAVLTFSGCNQTPGNIASSCPYGEFPDGLTADGAVLDCSPTMIPDNPEYRLNVGRRHDQLSSNAARATLMTLGNTKTRR